MGRNRPSWNVENPMPQFPRLLALLALLGAIPSWATAEQVRYHFVPADACGKMQQVPAGPDGTIGELKRVLGARALPYPYAVHPNQRVTFRDPFPGGHVTVPLRMPAGTPRMEHISHRI